MRKTLIAVSAKSPQPCVEMPRTVPFNDDAPFDDIRAYLVADLAAPQMRGLVVRGDSQGIKQGIGLEVTGQSQEAGGIGIGVTIPQAEDCHRRLEFCREAERGRSCRSLGTTEALGSLPIVPNRTRRLIKGDCHVEIADEFGKQLPYA